MKLNTLLCLALFGITFTSCNLHEVIPPPEQRVDLKAHFKGYINGTYAEFTENVDGFYMETSKDKQMNSNDFSKAIYNSKIISPQKNISLTLMIGEISWDGEMSDDPNVIAFEKLFKDYPTPKFNINAKAILGDSSSTFDLRYKDANGNLWKADPTYTNNVEFTYLSQESDKTGDYMKYIAKLDVQFYRDWWEYTYDDLGMIDDSIEHHDYWVLSDGVLRGWFKR